MSRLTKSILQMYKDNPRLDYDPDYKEKRVEMRWTLCGFVLEIQSEISGNGYVENVTYLRIKNKTRTWFYIVLWVSPV